MSSTNFWSGRASQLWWYVDGSKYPIDVQSWSVAPFGTQVSDSICGSNRAEIQTHVEGYDITLVCLMRGVDEIKAALGITKNDDALVRPVHSEITIQIRPNDGTFKAFMATGVTVGMWKWSVTGAKDQATVTIPLKARSFVDVTMEL